MLKYTILIRCSPYDGSLAHTAWKFAQEVLRSGHKIETIFFYQRGVLTANMLTITPGDELNVTILWQKLALKHKLELNVCISAASHQGVIDIHIAQQYELQQHNLANGFTLTGLGCLVSASKNCDRMISFGA